ncbi:MAG: folylpolyglutamate synthase/dihydrofolate synthase family protein [bacterium]
MKPGLERMEAACEKMGHPERRYPSIHIAGTNGKGSVAAMLHSVYTEAGYRVGLFTSPHLVRVNERFRVGDREISDARLEEVLSKIPETELSFFERCTLLAFQFFAEENVDLAVFEVGLGGRLDATNVLTPRLSVITEIALDHTEILGNDLASIAYEKGGIIKPGVPVVCGATKEEAKKVIRALSGEKKSPFHEAPASRLHSDGTFDVPGFSRLRTGLTGVHQAANAATAMQALRVLGEVLPSLSLRESEMRRGLEKVRWPGRMEWVSEDPPVLFDGAHNPSGIRALVDSLIQGPGPSLHWKVLFSCAKEKDAEEMLAILRELSASITVCRMKSARSADPSRLKGVSRSGLSGVETYRSLRDGLKGGEALLVTGSLYFIGEIKGCLPRPTSG